MEDKCCGNCKLKTVTEGVKDCGWVAEFVRSGGKLPIWILEEERLGASGVYDAEGTDCETWQEKEG